MKILWEDIYKYGTQEEVQFLTEMAGLVGDYMEIVRKIHTLPNLVEEFSNELEIIRQKVKDNDLSRWISKDPQAQEFLNKFKNALKISGGRITTGAFSSTK